MKNQTNDKKVQKVNEPQLAPPEPFILVTPEFPSYEMFNPRDCDEARDLLARD